MRAVTEPGRTRHTLSIENIATATLAMCAIAVTLMMARHEFMPRTNARSSQVPALVKGWEEYARGTERIGSQNAAVTIVAFSDFQCPFCRAFFNALDSARAKYGDRITMVFRNVPITQIHPFARPAAIAAECASRQSRFAEYHDFLFHHQDSLGTLNWSSVAQNAGVTDTAKFKRCLGGGDVLSTLKDDSLAAAKLGVTGTPTVLVNGWRFNGAPSAQQLDSAVAHELERTKHAP